MELKQQEQKTPLNHRAKWTLTELEVLLEEVKLGLSFETIAEKHHRTIGAIKYKLYRYIIQLLKNNPNLRIDDLIKITSLTKEEIISGLKKLNYNYNYNEDKNKKVENNIMKIIGKILLFQIIIFSVGVIYQKSFMQV